MTIEVKKEHLELIKNLKIVNMPGEFVNEDIPLNFSCNSSEYFKAKDFGSTGDMKPYIDEITSILEKSDDSSIHAKLKLSDGDLYPIVLMKTFIYVIEILLQNLSIQEGVYERVDGFWTLVDA